LNDVATLTRRLIMPADSDADARFIDRVEKCATAEACSRPGATSAGVVCIQEAEGTSRHVTDVLSE